MVVIRTLRSENKRQLRAAEELDWDVVRHQSLLDRVNPTGQKLTNFDPIQEFCYVKFARLKAGEKVIGAG
jgi:hypothetical protein